jgi:cyclopropane fatty-acyl-phospholipid synthase-like methyltransferase
VTADVVTFTTTKTYDRVMSIEMFEHMKNYQVRSSDPFQAGLLTVGQPDFVEMVDSHGQSR